MRQAASFVQAMLRKYWSPKQISWALVREYLDESELRVSHETIYLSLYIQTRDGPPFACKCF